MTQEIVTVIRPSFKKQYEHICYLCGERFLSHMKRNLHFCPVCLSPSVKSQREAALKVRHNLHRAKKAELPATLTVKQWLSILDDFEWKCAYCLTRSYECLEHFNPIELGGGTTQANVLPACLKCNRHKVSYSPETMLSKEVFNRLSLYLQEKEREIA